MALADVANTANMAACYLPCAHSHIAIYIALYVNSIAVTPTASPLNHPINPHSLHCQHLQNQNWILKFQTQIYHYDINQMH